MTLAVITVTRQGIALGERILAAEPGAVLYVPAKYDVAADDRRRVFPGPLAPLLAEIYGGYDGFVFLMATGIVVRMVAEHIRDKRYDPAVVVMDITGRFAISLVSGHLGGANALARRLAEITGAVPVITTGTDVNETIAPDVIAMEIGGEVDDFQVMKKVSAALVDGDPTGVVDLTGVDPPSLRGTLKANVKILPTLEALRDAPLAAGIVITNRLLDLTEHRHPSSCSGRRISSSGSDAIAGRGPTRSRKRSSVSCSGTPCRSRASGRWRRWRPSATRPVLLGAAARLGLPVAFCDRDTLNAVPDVPNPSAAPMKFVGVQGVAEPSALAVSGGPAPRGEGEVGQRHRGRGRVSGGEPAVSVRAPCLMFQGTSSRSASRC